MCHHLLNALYKCSNCCKTLFILCKKQSFKLICLRAIIDHMCCPFTFNYSNKYDIKAKYYRLLLTMYLKQVSKK